jgi:7-cyano-7-deazaguanine reductase
MNEENIYKDLTQLGGDTSFSDNPENAILETIQNSMSESNYIVRFTVPEFTSMCPVTGQPDFAHFVIDYIPDKKLVESKSLKLYLNSFRNHGAFHEDCTISIARRLVAALTPRWLRIGGYWYPRGGMPIDVYYQYGELPEGMWVPDQGVAPYRGRG